MRKRGGVSTFAREWEVSLCGLSTLGTSLRCRDTNGIRCTPERAIPQLRQEWNIYSARPSPLRSGFEPRRGGIWVGYCAGRAPHGIAPAI